MKPKIRISLTVFWRLGIFLLSAVSIITIMAAPISLRPPLTSLTVGQVAFLDIRATSTFTYTSDLLTEDARKEAERSVAPVYLPADPTISRNQMDILNKSLVNINFIRNNSELSKTEKLQSLMDIQDFNLSSDIAELILEIKDERWSELREEATLVLERVMRNAIREDQVAYYCNIVPALISLSFNEKESDIIEALVSPLLVFNSVYSNEKTNEAIEQARGKIEPITRTYLAGETIISNGEVIAPEIWEALQASGYVQQTDESYQTISIILIVIASIMMPPLFLKQTRSRIYGNVLSLLLISLNFILFLLVFKIVIANHVVLPYIFPLAAFGLTLAGLFDHETGLIYSLTLATLCSVSITNNLEVFLFYISTSWIAILLFNRGRRVSNFFIAGLGIWTIGSIVVLAFRLITSSYTFESLLTLSGAILVNGIGSISITFILQYVLSPLLGQTTALQLMDLARPDQPLLRFLLTNAPGTYQHSLQVANLAEQAANEIKCDALLVRVGALYHDIGKATTPEYFIENQIPNQLDSHENENPKEVADTIIKHVNEGLKLASKYRIPSQIKNFIREHHGTTLARFQYHMAVKQSNNGQQVIDENMYRYAGPIPQSCETAILMLADACEAKARADSPKNEEEIQKLVSEVIQKYLKEGQLDNADLTLHDLDMIKKSFISTLSNINHKRIKYPA
jgi:hypothetical protein